MILLDLVKLRWRFRNRHDASRKMIADRERRAFDRAAAKFQAYDAENEDDRQLEGMQQVLREQAARPVLRPAGRNRPKFGDDR